MEKSTTCVASSAIVIQVGQCGNQIGPKFFKVAQSGQTGFMDSRSNTQTCRAVCVDTESKVVNYRNMEQGMKCKYREGNLVTGHFGRGSNWAMGYNMEERYGIRGEDSFLDSCLNKVRLEAERCDCFMSSLMLHSVAGGTGGGVGSRLCQEVRDMFPNRCILSGAVAPFSCGENPMQWYNTLFCTSHLAQFSDQIILLRNDDFVNKFDNNTSSVSPAGGPSSAKYASSTLDLSHINQQFAFNLAGILFPTDNVNDATSSASSGICKFKNVRTGMEIPELVRSCCPMSDLRFTRLDGCYKLDSNHSYDKLLSSLGVSFKSTLQNDDVTIKSAKAATSLANDDIEMTSPSCISCVAVLRGQPQGFPKYDAVVKRLAFLKYVPWNPYPLDLWVSSNGIPSKACTSVTVCSNSSSAAGYLEKVWSCARVKFNHNAYLHWYERYECSRDDFTEAFNNVASIVESYREAVA